MIQRVLTGLVLFGSWWLPIFASNTTPLSRILWGLHVTTITVFLLSIVAFSGLFVTAKYTMLGVAFCVPLLMFATLIIANTITTSNTLGYVSEQIAGKVEIVFPFLGEFENAGVLSDTQIVKARALNMLWMFAPVFVVTPIFSRAHLTKIWDNLWRTHRAMVVKRTLTLVVALSVFVALWFGLGNSSSSSGRSCVLHASCFLKDDLLLIANAMLRSLIFCLAALAAGFLLTHILRWKP